MFNVLFFVMFFISSLVYSQEAGMIDFDTEAGEIGGKGHWYSLRTMKGKEYWNDPALLVDIIKNEDGTYSMVGETPISLTLVLSQDYYPDDEPWRRAINMVRETEQMFRNSGVPIRFIIEEIITWNDMADGTRSAFEQLRSKTSSIAAKTGADLVVGLKPHYFGDAACGVASLGKVDWYWPLPSMTSCNSTTLAHELGHNFGLYHSFNPGREGFKGYCRPPSDPNEYDCAEGTIMSYSQNRLKFFANKNAQYRDKPLGTDDHDAVEFLNKVKTGRGLAWELNFRDNDNTQSELDHETVYCES